MRRVAGPVIAAAVLWLAGLAAPVRSQPVDAQPVTIVSVVDGDTVDVQLADGRIERLRLIGIDTPETKDPRRPVMCFGAEASARTAELALGREALLEYEIQPRDRYGRLLGYLWIDGQNLNIRLAAEGYAAQLTIPPNVRYAEEIRLAVVTAREQGLGLWGACGGPNVAATDYEEPVPAADSAPAPMASCHPSYPDVCIPPPPPDLDCPDIPHRNFRIVGADPHRFDADRDGIGCEAR